MRNRCGSKRIPISLFLLITTIAGITFVVGWSRLEETGMVARLYVFEGGDLPSSNAVSVHDHLLGSERGHSKMRLLLKESGFSPIKNVTLEKILNIQNWLGNQVKAVDSHKGSQSGYELMHLAREGTGMTCGSMSLMLEEALLALEVNARTVQLFRTNFNRLDTHVVVEVRLQERWVVLDPTFNLTYESTDGTPLGIAEIQKSLANSQSDAVTPVYHGDRAYPARLSEYPLNWQVLFANAYVNKPCRDCPWWKRLPPMRFWLGPARYGFGESFGPMARQHNLLYFMLNITLPFIAIISSCGALYLMWRKES
jgi:hypothetical protein